MAKKLEKPSAGTGSSNKGSAPTNFAFLDAFSDPQKDSSDPNVKKFIKTWSARNRTGASRPNPKPIDSSKDAAPSFVKGGTGGKGWQPGHLFRVMPSQGSGAKSNASGEAGPRRRKKASVREQQQTTDATKSKSRGSRSPVAKGLKHESKSYGFDDDDDDESTTLVRSRQSINGNSLIDGMKSPISAAPTDPFDTLPVHADSHAHRMMHIYLNCDLIDINSTSGGQSLKKALVYERKTKWFRYALESPAAYCALVAYLESTRGLLSDGTEPPVLRKYLGQALAGAQKELSTADNLAGDTTLFAIFILMLSALRMHDNAALKHHAEGLCVLLKRRRDTRQLARQASLSGGSLSDQERSRQPSIDTSLSSSSIEEESSKYEFYTGNGFADLASKGYLSERFWMNFQSNILVFNPTVLYGREDAFFTKLWSQHMLLDGGPNQFTATPLETVCISTLRARWHVIAWPTCGHSCVPIQRHTSRIGHWLPYTDLVGLTATDPDALLWILLIAGPFSRANPSLFRRFSQIFLRVLESTGLWDFGSCLKMLQTRWMWHDFLDEPAERFWNECLGFADADGEGEADDETTNLCDNFSLLAINPRVMHGDFYAVGYEGLSPVSPVLATTRGPGQIPILSHLSPPGSTGSQSGRGSAEPAGPNLGSGTPPTVSAPLV